MSFLSLFPLRKCSLFFFVWHYLSHKSYLTPPLCIWSVCAKTTKWAVMYICEWGVSILPHLTICFYWILEMFLQCGIFCFLFIINHQHNKPRWEWKDNLQCFFLLILISIITLKIITPLRLRIICFRQNNTKMRYLNRYTFSNEHRSCS